MTSGYTAPPPAEDVEYHHAHRLLGQDNPLDRRIVENLVGRPRRYGELKGLLDGKRDHNLTMALDRLRRDGIIDQRIDAASKPPVKSYELTNLGIQVVLRMHEMIPAHVSAQILLRGQIASGRMMQDVDAAIARVQALRSGKETTLRVTEAKARVKRRKEP